MNVSREHGVARRLAGAASAVLCAAALLSGCTSDSGSGSAPGPGTGSASGADSEAASKTPGEAAQPSVRRGDGGERGGGQALQSAYQQTVQAVLPSVVQITTGQGLGSGIVYDKRGHIVTNAHVVGDAEAFDVTLATGRDTLRARVVSSFPPQDLAVIKLDDPPKGLKPAVFGDSGKVGVGQLVLAMGSPLGLSGSVTQGIVSAVGRTVNEGRSGGGTGATISNLVQTSAAINPGNSGGALVNLDEQVIGIPTLAATDPELGDAAAGIGFAIPASTVTDIADQMIKSGRVTESGKATLGITGRTVLGADYRPAGVAVAAVARGGAAAKAGVRAGDIVVRLGNAKITTMSALSEALARYAPGDRTKLTYARDGDERTVSVSLSQL
ncbi:S1C family serine protease [Streptomyces zagrosensis]|uniref:S1-C subfamily serine protease n=1 Tax=Streptomyces zagrosensis TaxID=1042984 RepID=A0A7W9UX71_9ACTN|nr:trypsin-like peptidase domain-containing protein [Streptomyces zagrosensis]MBB5933404.1 S1-C subfamily serine protease [Streptomyces zagrosensis]